MHSPLRSKSEGQSIGTALQVERLAQTEPWTLLQAVPVERRNALASVRRIAQVVKRDSEILLDSFWQVRSIRSFAELLESTEEIQKMEKDSWDA